MAFESPKFEGKELPALSRWTERGAKEALSVVKERFEDRDNNVENLDFHNTQHTQNVIQRTEKILLAMREGDSSITEKDITLGKLSSAYHDIVQKWEENKIQDGNFEKVMRRRFIGNNEKASARAALGFMEEANQEAGEEIFKDEDIEMVREAIVITIPEFDTERKTVIQPHLNKESSFVATALALADIGAAGMEGYNEFGREGDALFREENLDILSALENPEELTLEQKEYFRNRMLVWSKFQSEFASGRKALLEKELSGLTSSVQDKVKDLFDKFDESITGTEATAAKRGKMTFEELAEDMGYRL